MTLLFVLIIVRLPTLPKHYRNGDLGKNKVLSCVSPKMIFRARKQYSRQLTNKLRWALRSEYIRVGLSIEKFTNYLYEALSGIPDNATLQYLDGRKFELPSTLPNPKTIRRFVDLTIPINVAPKTGRLRLRDSSVYTKQIVHLYLWLKQPHKVVLWNDNAEEYTKQCVEGMDESFNFVDALDFLPTKIKIFCPSSSDRLGDKSFLCIARENPSKLGETIYWHSPDIETGEDQWEFFGFLSCYKIEGTSNTRVVFFDADEWRKRLASQESAVDKNKKFDRWRLSKTLNCLAFQSKDYFPSNLNPRIDSGSFWAIVSRLNILEFREELISILWPETFGSVLIVGGKNSNIEENILGYASNSEKRQFLHYTDVSPEETELIDNICNFGAF